MSSSVVTYLLCLQVSNFLDLIFELTTLIGSHLEHQTEIWMRLIKIHESLMTFASVEEKTAKLKSVLQGQNSLEDFISPLDPGLLLGKLDVEKAKVFASKKMPLMLTWDTGALLFKVIFGSKFHRRTLDYLRPLLDHSRPP